LRAKGKNQDIPAHDRQSAHSGRTTDFRVFFGEAGAWGELARAEKIFPPANRTHAILLDKNFQNFSCTSWTFHILEASCLRVLLTDNVAVVTTGRSMCMYASMYVNRAAYFLGGVLTGILGIAAAACVTSLMDERNRYKECMLWMGSMNSSPKDSPAASTEEINTTVTCEDAATAEAAEAPDADAAQTA